MPRYDEPTTIAGKVAEALRANDGEMLYQWLDRVPSIAYPAGKDIDLLVEFQRVAKECGRTLQQDWNVTSEAGGVPVFDVDAGRGRGGVRHA